MRERGDFYVGYLSTPRPLALFLRRTAIALVTALALGAWALSAAQNDPGDGLWHDDLSELVGRVSATPYPLIRVPTEDPVRPIQTILLVSEGKHGGGERVVALDGRMARVRGTMLERGGMRLMELATGDAVKADDSLSATAVARLMHGERSRGADGIVTLRGEIIDPKCYAGAMKPGEGKVHKECATLCIAGGIPPMFLSRDATGRRSFYLLTDRDGRALRGDVLRGQVLPFVADAVELRGGLERSDDLMLLKIDPAEIRRL